MRVPHGFERPASMDRPRLVPIEIAWELVADRATVSAVERR